MRVLRIIARLNAGGPARHVINLNDGLERRGVTTELLFGEPDAGEGSLESLLATRRVPSKKIPGLGRSVRPGNDVRAFFEIRRAMAAFGPDVVHTHTAKAGALGRVVAAFGNLLRPRRTRRLIVHTFHGHVLDGYFGVWGNRVVRVVERALARMSHRIIAISPRQREDLVTRFRIAPAAKVKVIPLGLDLAPFLALPDRESARPVLRCGFIGRLVPIKDVPTLVRGFALAHAERSSMTLTLVGGGEGSEAIRALVSELGLTGVIQFEPFTENLADVYARLDVVILTSRNEGTPVALIEAMAAGCAVVSTNVGGVPDVVEDGVTGVLIPPADPRALADALLAMSRDPARTRQIAARARAGVGARFAVDRLVDDVNQLYVEGLAELRGGRA